MNDRLADAAAFAGLCVLLWSLAMVPAVAQEPTDCAEVAAMPGAVERALAPSWATSDRIVAAPSNSAAAVLCYENSGEQTSSSGAWRITVGGLEITGHVEVTPGPERLRITPPPGHMVYPADDADARVDDGAAVIVTIYGGIM